MVNDELKDLYERIRKTYGEKFSYGGGDYTMQRDVDGLVISIEPPQERLGHEEGIYVLLTAPLLDETPERLIDRLNILISKRDILKRKGYIGELRNYADGIEYLYDIPKSTESNLERIVRDFNDI